MDIRDTVAGVKVFKDDEIGKCYLYPNGDALIVIKRDYWDWASPIIKRSLVFHELSHCILGLNHSDNINHYMYRSMSYDLTIQDLYTQVVEDVRNNCH